MRRFALAAVVSLVNLPTLVSAQFYEGNDILNLCETNKSAAYGYVAGVIDFHEYYVAQTYGSPFFCIPNGVTVRQAADVACEHIKTHVAARHLGAGGLVQGALNIAFPCP